MTVRLHRLAYLSAVVALCLLAAGLAPQARAAAPKAAGGPLKAVKVGTNQVLAVPYYAWNNKARYATVVLPRDYVPWGGEVLPCIVQPHGRGSTPLGPASRWGDLPSTERFMVICPDSSGRRDPYNSWGVAGQLRDIAEIAGVVEASIPWLRLDRERLYLAGISMGGQETLCTIARYPDVFAAGLCVDGNADMAKRYREFRLCGMKDSQPLLRREVGGTPNKVPWLYARRSSTPFAATLATCGVPISIWWSTEDAIGYNQAKTQTGYLYSRIMKLNPAAPVTQVIGKGAHGTMLSRHPEDAVAYLRPGGVWRTQPSAPSSWDYRSWVTDATAWGYRFTTASPGRKFWRVHVAPGSLQVWSPKAVTATVPYDAALPAPATITVNGVARLVAPVEGTVTITFPAGASTATWPVL
jgi:pimeloyl-ACP methyl ester carboxylesterase